MAPSTAPPSTAPPSPATVGAATISPPQRSAQLRPRAIGGHEPNPPLTAPGHRDWPVILFMAALHALALLALLPRFWSLPALASLLVLYWLTACLGVTIGYHRLLSHRAFRVPQWLERVFATCGALSCQQGPITWAGLHRHHHKFSDTDPDHHNSHRGFWWSHMGWMFEGIPALAAAPLLSGDLVADPYYRWLNRWFLLLQLPLGVLLFWIGTALDHGNAGGGWSLLLWGIPLRLVLVYHATWLVNSATHRWGYAPHASGDASRNNPWVAAVTFGEGWHNTHHAYPHSARHGWGWREPDLTWMHIRLLQRLGLATQVRLPRPLREAVRPA